MPAAPPPSVEVDRVLVVGPSNSLCQRLALFGHSHQMDVIRHQAIAEQRELPAPAMAAEKRQVDPPVGGREEDLLAVVAPLSDVVRCADRHHARDARHAISIDYWLRCRQVFATKW